MTKQKSEKLSRQNTWRAHRKSKPTHEIKKHNGRVKQTQVKHMVAKYFRGAERSREGSEMQEDTQDFKT